MEGSKLAGGSSEDTLVLHGRVLLCLLGKTNDLEESGTALFWACSQTLHGQGPEITSCEPLVPVIQLTMRVDSDVELRCS